MAVQIQTRRSSTVNDRPFPIRLGEGELALNNNSVSPGLFFADNTASPNTGLIKVGPVHIGSTAPNTSGAGFTSLSKGETWLDTISTHVLKIFDGTSFVIHQRLRTDQIQKDYAKEQAGSPWRS